MRGLQRPRASRRDARVRRPAWCATLATGHYARVEARDDAAGPLLRQAADPAKDQTYMLAALVAGVAGADALSAGRLREAAGPRRSRRRRACQSRARLTPRTSASWRARRRGRFLQRHGGIAPHRGEIVDADGTVVGAHAGHELFTVGQRRGVGVAVHRAAVRARQGRRRQPGRRRPPGATAHRPCARPRRAPAPRRRTRRPR